MYMLFVFGREVERFIGRRAYIALYVLLLFTPAALLTIWGLWQVRLSPVRPHCTSEFLLPLPPFIRGPIVPADHAKWVALILAAV